MATCLVAPSIDQLPGYIAALRRGWSPDTVRGPETIAEQLRAIDDDPVEFLAGLNDETPGGDPIQLPDGSTVPRLPGFHRWIWDGEFCGRIGLRWQPGTSDLPPHVLGHIGFTVVPWKRQRGHATAALSAILPEARGCGLSHVELTADLDNAPSQRVILSAGGRLVEQFEKPTVFGGGRALRFRIIL